MLISNPIIGELVILPMCLAIAFASVKVALLSSSSRAAPLSMWKTSTADPVRDKAIHALTAPRSPGLYLSCGIAEQTASVQDVVNAC